LKAEAGRNGSVIEPALWLISLVRASKQRGFDLTTTGHTPWYPGPRIGVVGRLRLDERWPVTGNALLSRFDSYDIIPAMPIGREHRFFYPIDWPQLSAVIRFRRAGGRCEGCGRPHGQAVWHLGDGLCWDAQAAS